METVERLSKIKEGLLREKAENKFDLKATKGKLSWLDGSLIIENGTRTKAKLNQVAFNQFTKLLKVPTGYLRKCSSDVASYVLNNELEACNQSDFIFRAIKNEAGETRIRSVHSANETLFDYEDMCDIITRITKHTKSHGSEYQIKKGAEFPNDNLWKLRMILNGSEMKIDEREEKLIFAFDIMGSETGLVLPRIEPIIWQEWCTNGMKSWSRDKDSVFSMKEIKTNKELFMSKLDNYIQLKWSEYTNKGEKFREAASILYDSDKADKIFINILEKTGVSKNNKKQNVFLERLHEANNHNLKISLYRLTSTITEIARDISGDSNVASSENLTSKMLKLNNRSEALEQEAGRLIEAA